MSLFLGVGAETLDGSEGFLLAAAADEPPWGLGGEEDEDQEGGLDELVSWPCCDVWGETHGKDPLQGQGDSPSPLIVALVVGIGSASDDDRSDRPTHLQSCRAGTSEGKRDNFGGVGGCVGDEETPWHTFQCLSNNKKGEGVGLETSD